MMRLTKSFDGPTCRKCGDWIEIHDGQPVCKSGCKQVTRIKQCECDEPERETRDGGRSIICTACGRDAS